MYSAVSTNKRNTVIIMATFLLLIGSIGALVGWYLQDYYVTIAVVFCAAIYAVIEYFCASRLAVSLSGGVEIKRSDNPALWNSVENMAITAGLPMPRVFIIDDPAPNAFATGRDPKHSYIAVTTGLLNIMDKRELEAVISHEMSHIKNYDIRVSMIVFGLVSAIGLISDLALRILFYSDNDNDSKGSPYIMLVGIVIVALSPFIAAVIQLAISRQREYLADASGSLLTRDSEGLARALEKLKDYGRPMQRQNSSMAHLFLNNPLKSGKLSSLFSTHPPLDDRIARLRNMGNKM